MGIPHVSQAKPRAAAVVAQPVSKKARKKAKRYEKKGKRAYKKERWDEAIVSFELAHGLHPAPRYLFNIGRCYEQKGDLFKAMEYVQTYADTVQDTREREDADEVREILRAKLARTNGEVRLSSTPPGAVVTLVGGGRKVQGTTPLARWLEAGTWDLEVALQDHETARDELVVQVGESLDKSYALRSKAEASAPQEAPPDTPSQATEAQPVAGAVEAASPGLDKAADQAAGRPASAPQDAAAGVLPHVLLWSGVALVGAGGWFGLQAAASEDEAQGFVDTPGKGTLAEARSIQDAAERHALTANILLGAGAVGAGAGIWLLMSHPDTAAFVPTPGGGLLAWRGRWP